MVAQDVAAGQGALLQNKHVCGISCSKCGFAAVRLCLISSSVRVGITAGPTVHRSIARWRRALPRASLPSKGRRSILMATREGLDEE